MPNITRKDRDRAKHSPITVGELNYYITVAILDFLLCKKINYENMNAITGVLDNVKAEFKRKIMDPYEEGKAMLNGDVYYERIDYNELRHPNPDPLP